MYVLFQINQNGLINHVKYCKDSRDLMNEFIKIYNEWPYADAIHTFKDIKKLPKDIYEDFLAPSRTLIDIENQEHRVLSLKNLWIFIKDLDKNEKLLLARINYNHKRSKIPIEILKKIDSYRF